MFDNKVQQMSPGEALLDAPMPELIQKMGLAIAEAQLRLDQMAVRVAGLLSEAKVEFKDAAGNVKPRSLLELGFTPTFYHFTETDIEIKLTLQMKIEEEFRVGGAVSLGVGGTPPAAPATGTGTTAPATGTGTTPATGTGTTPATGSGIGDAAKGAAALGQAADKRGVMFGATISAEYHRKYEFDMSGSSMIKTKMIAVPPPAAFLEAIKEHARAGGTVAAPA